MPRFLTVLVFLLCLAAPAQAQEGQPFSMDDPQARRMACTAWHETEMLGPYDAQVSIFSVPEPDGSGRRLYVGFVDDLLDRASRVRMWRGPVASAWRELSPVPEYKPRYSGPNPARYRVKRSRMVSGGREIALMEIDLEASPPRLKLVDAPTDAPGLLHSLPLEEITPLNESMRLLPRLSSANYFYDSRQQVASYRLIRGGVNPPAKRPLVIDEWEAPMGSHLLLVCLRDNPDKAMAYFLPMRPNGWGLKRMLPDSAARCSKGRIALEMFAGYFYPGRSGDLTVYHSRNLVTVGMEGMSITTLETGYLYDVGREDWLKVEEFAPKKKRR